MENLGHYKIEINTIEDPEIWDAVEDRSIEEFLKLQTLHDSYLWSVRIVPRIGIIIILDWDLHWASTPDVGYRRIAICFCRSYGMRWTNGTSVVGSLAGVSSHSVTPEERNNLFESQMFPIEAYQQSTPMHLIPFFDEELQKTILTGHDWSVIEILHHERVKIANVATTPSSNES